MEIKETIVTMPIETYEKLLEDAKLTCNDVLAENISLSINVDYYKKQYGEQFDKVAQLERNKYITDSKIKGLEMKNNQLKEKYEESLMENNKLGEEVYSNKFTITTLYIVSVAISILLIISVL